MPDEDGNETPAEREQRDQNKRLRDWGKAKGEQAKNKLDPKDNDKK